MIVVPGEGGFPKALVPRLGLSVEPGYRTGRRSALLLA